MNGKQIMGAGLVGLLVGVGTGWLVTSLRARHNLVFFLHGLAKSEIYAQEQAASVAYLSQPPEVATWALNQLVQTYGRYTDVPTPDPEEWKSGLRNSSALVYARLADTYAQQGLEEKRRAALVTALALGRYEDEAQLMKNLRHLNEAERKQLRPEERPAKTPKADF